MDMSRAPAAATPVIIPREGLHPPYERARGYDPITLPYQALVCLCFDDCDDMLHTADVAFDNLTAAQFCASHGIPISLGVITGRLDTTGMITSTQLKNAYQWYGWEPVNHLTDKTAPTSVQDWFTKVKGGKSAIEGITGMNCQVRSMRNAGEFTSPYNFSDTDFSHFTDERTTHLRREYEVSICGGGMNSTVMGKYPRTVVGSFGQTLSTAGITDEASAQAYIENLCSFGARTMLYFHTTTDISLANLRYVIDTLIVKRNAGTLGVVNMHTLCTAELAPQNTVLYGGIFNPGFEGAITVDGSGYMTATSFANKDFWYKYTQGATQATTTWQVVSDGDVGSGTYAIEGVAADDAGTYSKQCLATRISLPPGYGYVLSFKAKDMGAGGAGVCVQSLATEGGTAGYNYIFPVYASADCPTVATTTSWARYYASIGTTTKTLSNIIIIGIARNSTVRLDDFSIQRV